MKALLNKEHHCYKMYASLLKSSPYPPFLDTPFMDYPFPILQENLELHPFYDFSKTQPLINTMGFTLWWYNTFLIAPMKLNDEPHTNF